jgi:predicted transport protein
VFTALNLGIRALDPNINQELLKVSIAYRCETNFVAIVPQTKQLKLPFLWAGGIGPLISSALG